MQLLTVQKVLVMYVCLAIQLHKSKYFQALCSVCFYTIRNIYFKR